LLKEAAMNLFQKKEKRLDKKSGQQKKGAFGESNSGPLAPKARIIPLDQMPNCDMKVAVIL
jgi:hypothetical protein